MSEYEPKFTCPHCNSEIEVAMFRQGHGGMGACGCQESRNAWETNHRAEMERRKVTRGRRTR